MDFYRSGESRAVARKYLVCLRPRAHRSAGKAPDVPVVPYCGAGDTLCAAVTCFVQTHIMEIFSSSDASGSVIILRIWNLTEKKTLRSLWEYNRAP